MSNLLEKDIENAFVAQAHRFGIEVLGQQVGLDVGIADLIGWSEHGYPVIIEIKRGKPRDTVVPQLLSYINSLRQRLYRDMPILEELPDRLNIGEVQGIVVAQSVRKMTRRLIASSHKWGNQTSIDLIRYRTDKGNNIAFRREVLQLRDSIAPQTELTEELKRRNAIEYQKQLWITRRHYPADAMACCDRVATSQDIAEKTVRFKRIEDNPFAEENNG